MKLTLVLVGGSVLIWVAILGIYTQSGLGTFNIEEIQKVIENSFSREFQIVFFLFLMVGFGILAGYGLSILGHPTGMLLRRRR
ncbi:MAG: hypothetical protein CM1200mP3_04100 [Chloroflexota bacterium]|nr:MAG: hypothetical protein CM1200mP3_04100 [Chloroflexota bacterium]